MAWRNGDLVGGVCYPAGSMTWRVLMQGADGQKYVSSALFTREDAISFAREVLRDGSLKVLKIESDQGETIKLDEEGGGGQSEAG